MNGFTLIEEKKKKKKKSTKGILLKKKKKIICDDNYCQLTFSMSMRVTGMLRPTRTITVLPHMSTPGNVLAHIKGTVRTKTGGVRCAAAPRRGLFFYMTAASLRARGVLVLVRYAHDNGLTAANVNALPWTAGGVEATSLQRDHYFRRTRASPRVLSSRTLWFSVGVPGRCNRPQQGILVTNKTMATRIGKHAQRLSP